MRKTRFTVVPTFAVLGLGAVLLSLTACQESAEAGDAADLAESAPARDYGPALAVGNGELRSYVLKDPATNAAVELGVAFSESALEGLPDLGSGHVSMEEMDESMFHQYNLELPAGHGTPFQFVEVNWNPFGHEPEGVYLNVPHFDFHFYTISQADRDAIMPDDPEWSVKAERLPDARYLPAHNLILSPPDMGPADVAVPMMGVHWVDNRSHELQGMFGNPDGYSPFTATFIHGTWDGKMIFWEPMITRDYILAKKAATDAAERDEVIALPMPEAYQTPGLYPDSYGLSWDPDAKEYRIALRGLAPRG